MKRLAVIGYPIKHSISPAMHQAALDTLGVEACYDRVEVAPDDLPAFVEELRGGEWSGINVTVPHKESVLPLLDEVAPEAAAIGAVNTIVVSGNRLIGHNTDAAGFIRALRDDGGFDAYGRVVALLGAGGAARAVLWSLVQSRARVVRLFNRGQERANRLAQAARGWGEWTEVVVERWGQDTADWQDLLSDCDLVINATSVGLLPDESPLAAGAIPSGTLVVDLIYNPRPTRLLWDAAGRELRTLDGLPMLVYQGAAAFELWTGLKAPVAVMLRAAEAALGVAPVEVALGSGHVAAPRRKRRTPGARARRGAHDA